MEVQSITVGLIIFAALFYVGKMALGKLKSFSSDKSCGAHCGCETKSKAKIAKV